MFRRLRQQDAARSVGLEEHISRRVLTTCVIITAVSSVFTIIENLGKMATLTAVVSILFMLVVLGVSRHTANLRRCYLAMCLFLNVLFLPLNFFSCGGVRSGMLLYYLVSVFLCVPCLCGKSRIAAVSISICALLASIALSFHVPSLVNEIPEKAGNLDMLVSFLITSICLCAVTAAVVASYEAERRTHEALLHELHALSTRDALTGLLNRRVLFETLEQTVRTDDRRAYVMMVDIDNFKGINDTYGHLFGDKVLCTCAQLMQENLDETAGELAARYGGEEFISVLYAEAPPEAEERAERLRTQISAIFWSEKPELQITVSGGCVPCCPFDNATQLLHRVDELLYEAKRQGKNRILLETEHVGA